MAADPSTGCDLLEPSLRGFSCPFEPFTEALAPMVAEEYARGISRAFLDRHRGRIEQDAPRVRAVLDRWLEGSGRGGGWGLCFGDAYRSVHRGETAYDTCIAAAMATHVGGLGLPGAWDARFSTPARLRWGRLLLPPCTALAVESDGATAAITTTCNGDRRSTVLTRDGQGWRGDVEHLPMVTRCSLQLAVLPAGALLLRDFDDLIAKALPSIDPRMVEVFDRAVEIIECYTPMYIPWIRRALHNVFVLYPRADTIESGSVEHYLGLIHVSAHAQPLPIAELLVHEAAHQHMNLLTKLGPVDDGSDRNMYYSPPVDKQRRVSLIMAAYHAFANVLLFYRLCRQNGIAERKECDRQEGILWPWLETLEAPLRDNPALTDIGRALWLPLKSQLQATA